jgi:hypothetical protein
MAAISFRQGVVGVRCGLVSGGPVIGGDQDPAHDDHREAGEQLDADRLAETIEPRSSRRREPREVTVLAMVGSSTKVADRSATEAVERPDGDQRHSPAMDGIPGAERIATGSSRTAPAAADRSPARPADAGECR